MLHLEQILSTFIKLPFVIKISALSIFEWPLRTGFTVIKTYLLFLFLNQKVCMFKNDITHTRQELNSEELAHVSYPISIQIFKNLFRAMAL